MVELESMVEKKRRRGTMCAKKTETRDGTPFAGLFERRLCGAPFAVAFAGTLRQNRAKHWSRGGNNCRP